MLFFPEIAHAQAGSPAAKAAVQGLMDKIIAVIVIPLIKVLFAFTILIFIWGVAGVIINKESPEELQKSQDHILWGVIGIFIMISAYGIVRLIANTIGVQAPF